MPGAWTSPASEAVLTMWPLRCSLSSGVKVRQPRTTPSRLMSTIQCHSSIVATSMRPPAATPALLTSRSRPPHVSRTWASAAPHASSLRTSSGRYAAASGSASGRSACRSVASTSSPLATKARTRARPRPEAPPVTRTRRGAVGAVERVDRRARSGRDGIRPNLLADRERHLAVRAALVDLGEGTSDVVERVTRADRRRQLAGLEERQDRLPLRAEVAGVGHPEGAPADADDAEVVEEQPVDLDLGDLAGGEADDEESALGGEAAEAVGEAVATDGIDDEVDPAAVRQLLCGSEEPVGEHDVVGARGAGRLDLVLGRDDRDDARVHGPGQLDGGCADPTRRAVDEDDLAALEPST